MACDERASATQFERNTSVAVRASARRRESKAALGRCYSQRSHWRRRPRRAPVELAVDATIAGTGIIYLFESWLRPLFESGALEPVLEPWWPSFPGPFLYYPGRRLVPAPLRAFIDFIRKSPGDEARGNEPQVSAP